MDTHLTLGQDLMNLQTADPKSIFGLAMRHFPFLDQGRGLLIRSYQKFRFFRTQAEVESAERQRQEHDKKFIELLYPQNTQLLSIHDTRGQDMVVKAQHALRDDAEHFFSTCREMKAFHPEFITQRWEALSSKFGKRLVTTPDGIRLDILGYPVLAELPIEDLVDWNAYVLPAFQQKASPWYNSRFCDECGKFFFYERKKARYCSDKCRMAAAYKMRRKKDEK